MVSLQAVQQSNARVSSLPKGLVALFMGATSGIAQSALQHFAQNASSPRIYSIARPTARAAHESFLDTLRQSNPSGTYNVITADISLISEVDKAVEEFTAKETKLDILVMSPGFIAFEGRKNTSEGLDPSMTTRYYSRLRAVQKLIPLLNKSAQSPRILSILAGGQEAPINEDDLDCRENYAFWPASVHTATMGTLALERFARENPRLSIVHWGPGPVVTPLFEKAKQFGMGLPNPMSQDESGQRALYLATSDRYAVEKGFVGDLDGSGDAKQSGGGIFLVGPQGESRDNEAFLKDMRDRGVAENIWKFTEKVFAESIGEGSGRKTEL